MRNPLSMLCWLLPGCGTGTGTKSYDAESVRALLDKDNIGILSASCCDATSSPRDEELKANLLQAMQQAEIERAVVCQTITAAQRHLRELSTSADGPQKQLIANVTTLFQSHGLGIFPLLIINGRVAFYGGVPSVEQIRQRLQRQPLTSLGA
ncbi:hypothetical protein [Azohydromonas aeria]|uniref:hypothetical protein n=1 Tax=Azohydromonas aeria TaxID=2590212 RepID=UPI0012FCE9E4|nr:hypothetical protein [Azohydromonas aeria]